VRIRCIRAFDLLHCMGRQSKRVAQGCTQRCLCVWPVLCQVTEAMTTGDKIALFVYSTKKAWKVPVRAPSRTELESITACFRISR
jgi:hypothetical protein